MIKLTFIKIVLSVPGIIINSFIIVTNITRCKSLLRFTFMCTKVTSMHDGELLATY